MPASPESRRWRTEPLIVGALLVAFLWLHWFIGGTRLLFSLPAFGLLGLAAVGTGFLLQRRAAEISMPCMWSAVAFVGWIAGRALFSPVEYLARPDLFLALAALTVYLLTAFYVPGSRARLILVLALLAAGIAHTVIGAIQFTQGENFMLNGLGRGDYGRRASGLFVCPNHLAGFLEIVAVMGASAICWSRWNRWLKAACALGILGALAGIALSGSRGGYLSTLTGFGVFAVLGLFAARRRMPGSFFRIALPAALGGVAVLAAAFFLMTRSAVLQERLGNLINTGDVRVLMWRSALRQWALQPVAGTGSATYLIHGRRFRDPRVQNDPIYVHSDYLQLLAEYGVIGAVAGLLLLGTHLTNGLAAFRAQLRATADEEGVAQDDKRALTIGALSAVAAYMAHSVVDFNLHIPANALLLAFIFGILAGRNTGPKVRHRSQLAPRLLLPVLGLILLLAGLPRLPGEWYAERARIALRDGRFKQAIEFATRGIALEGSNPDLFYYLGEAKRLSALSKSILPRKALSEEALTAFRQGLRLFAEDERSLVKAGLALDVLGRYGEAEGYFQRAITADPNLGAVYAHYGLHFQIQGKFEEATAQFQKAQEFSANQMATVGLAEIAASGKPR